MGSGGTFRAPLATSLGTVRRLSRIEILTRAARRTRQRGRGSPAEGPEQREALFITERSIMLATRRSRFESLEKRLALTVTATVSAGDLVVSGDADGAVQITSVGTGTFEVRDNGALIADSSTLTGVNRNVKIDIDPSAGADNKVTLDLGTQAVEKIY